MITDKFQELIQNRTVVIISFVVTFFGFFLLNSSLKNYLPDYVLTSSQVNSKNRGEFLIFIVQLLCLAVSTYTAAILIPNYKREIYFLIPSIFLFFWATTHIQIQMPDYILPYTFVQKKKTLVFFFNVLRVASIAGVIFAIKGYFDKSKAKAS
jgi:hypothetical protein